MEILGGSLKKIASAPLSPLAFWHLWSVEDMVK